MQELIAVLAIASPISSFLFAFIMFRRNQKADDVEAVRREATYQASIDALKSSIEVLRANFDAFKATMDTFKADVIKSLDGVGRKLDKIEAHDAATDVKLAVVEQSDEDAHKSLDRMSGIVAGISGGAKP